MKSPSSSLDARRKIVSFVRSDRPLVSPKTSYLVRLPIHICFPAVFRGHQKGTLSERLSLPAQSCSSHPRPISGP